MKALPGGVDYFRFVFGAFAFAVSDFNALRVIFFIRSPTASIPASCTPFLTVSSTPCASFLIVLAAPGNSLGGGCALLMAAVVALFAFVLALAMAFLVVELALAIGFALASRLSPWRSVVPWRSALRLLSF